MKDKIKILLIDDDPFRKSLPSDTDAICLTLGIGKEQLVEFEDRDFGFPIFKNLIEEKYKSFSDFFELKWLFSTSAIRDYLNKMNHIEDMCGHKLISRNGFIPDIVVFDYALTDSQSNQPEDYGQPIVNEKLNPCYQLDKFIDENKLSILKPRNKKEAEDEKGNYQYEGEKNEDRFGLFAGGLIVEKFRRDIPCFGVPATYWTRTKLNRSEAGFFEWLLEQSFGEALEREKRDKEWGIIIDIALPSYRESIKRLISLNKIHVDLNEILALLNGKFLKKDGETERDYKCFTFQSVYGKREIPLDGLFIDIPTTEATAGTICEDLAKVSNGKKVTERDIEIWNFSNEIVKIISTDKLNYNELTEAKGYAMTVWKVYCEEFESRIYFSDYMRMEKEGLFFQQRERKHFIDLRNDFLQRGLIRETTAKDGTFLVEFSDTITITGFFNKKSEKSKEKVRLAILYLAAFAEIELKKSLQKLKKSAQNSVRKTDIKDVSYKITELDIYYILNPRLGDVLLSNHGGRSLARITESWLQNPAQGLCIPGNNSFYSFKWAEPSELKIIRNFFYDVEGSLLPEWLTN